MRATKIIFVTVLLAALSANVLAEGYPDISTVPADLTIPPIETGSPRAGARVAVTPPEYKDTDVHHVLYLPVNWEPEKKYPVLVEYAGNGNYRNKYGDVSTPGMR